MVIQLLSCVCGKVVIPHRYVLAFMVFMAIITCYNMRLCLHMAITEIAAAIPASEEVVHDVCPDIDEYTEMQIKGGTYNWTERQQGIILMSFFPGYLITHLPGGMIADKLGGRYVLAICVIGSTLFTFLTPLAIYLLDWVGVIIVRFLTGLAQGPLFPASASLLSQWIPKQERARVGGCVYSGIQLGSVSGNLITGLIIHWSNEWPLAFYVWGLTGILWSVVFLLLCYSKPSDHPYITVEEKAFLLEEIGPSRTFKTPWKPILGDMAVWSLVIVQTGHDYLTYTYLVDLPKFLKQVLRFNIAKNGMVSGMTFFLMWISSIITGWISDYITNKSIMSIIQIRKLYTTIASMGPSICSVIATHVGCDRVPVITAIWLGMFLMGPWFPGPKINNLDLSLNFSGLIMSLTNGVGVLSGIAAPYVVAEICKDGTLEQWQIVFWIALVISVGSLIVFLIWGQGERRPWDYIPEQ